MLAFAGLVRQAQLVRDGEVSSRELVELSLERIDRFDRELNAFGAVYAEQALAEADAPRPAWCPRRWARTVRARSGSRPRAAGSSASSRSPAGSRERRTTRTAATGS